MCNSSGSCISLSLHLNLTIYFPYSFLYLLQDQADVFLEGLQNLDPQDHIAAVKPFWETLSQDERLDLLLFPLEDLHAYAKLQAERQKKQAEMEAAEALQLGRVNLNFDPPLDDTFAESIERTKANGTWKVWEWAAEGKEFFDSESFRKYMEEHLIDPELLKYLPREEEGAKVAEKPAEAALRQRMTALLTKIQENRQVYEEANNNQRRLGRKVDTQAAARDINVDQVMITS